MATYNSIADELAGDLDRDFDPMFKERIKEEFKHQLALLVRQDINKRGLSDLYVTSFNADIIDVTNDDTVNIKNTSNTVYRTKNKIPIPITYNSDDLYSYVGTTDGKLPFIYTKLYALQFAGLNNINNVKAASYVYQNQYLYLYNTGILTIDPSTFKLMIGGSFPIGDIMSNEDTLNNITFQDDTTLIFPENLIVAAKLYLLKGEYSIIDDRDKVPSKTVDNN